MKKPGMAALMFVCMNLGLTSAVHAIAAGFTLESRADILRNPDDNLETSVFDESIRWQSERSVLKFRK